LDELPAGDGEQFRLNSKTDQRCPSWIRLRAPGWLPGSMYLLCLRLRLDKSG
jgi:hypothetical protein